MAESLARALRHHAAERPSAPALDNGRGTTLRYGELAAAVERLARRLRLLRIATLALLADNGPAAALVDLAAARAGTTLLSLPPFFSDEQIQHALEVARPAAVLTDAPARIAALAEARRDDDVHALAWLWLRRDAVRHQGISTLTFTSGSTGAPKGVALPPRCRLAAAHALARATATGKNERHLALLPLSVLLESVAGLDRVLLAGGCVVLPPPADLGAGSDGALDPSAVRAALARHGATSAIFVPETLRALLTDTEDSRAAPPAHLRFLGVGGAPVPLDLLARAEALGLPVYEGYGLSEAASVVALNTPDARRAGSVGRPLPHLTVSLAPDGEILLRGPLFAAYLGGARGPTAWQDWPTGDLGARDDEGFLYVTGRRKNLCITSYGRNFAPEWIERALLDRRAVAQAVVLGDGLPAPVAVLVPQADLPPAALEAAVYAANAALPPYARVARWIAVPPLTVASGCWTSTGRPRREAVAATFGARLGLRAPAPFRSPSPLLSPLPVSPLR